MRKEDKNLEKRGSSWKHSSVFHLLASVFLLLTSFFCSLPSMAAIYTGGSGEGYGYAQGNSCMYYGGNGEGYSVIAMTSDTTVGYNTTPTQLAFTTSPSNSYAGAAFGTQPIVDVNDTYGNIVLSATNNVTLSINNDPVGSSTLGGTTSMAAVAGVANFSGQGVYVSRAGNGYALSAASSPLTAATSSIFNSLSPVQLSSPWTGSQALNVNALYPVSWNTYGSLATNGNTTLQYSLNNGGSWTTLETVPATLGSSSYGWTTPSTGTTQAEVRVVNSADSTFTNTSAVFTLSAGLTITSPISSSFWAAGFSHSITWITLGTVNTVNLYYSTSSSGPWTLINTGGAISNSSGTGPYSWKPPVSLGGTYYIEIADANSGDATNPGVSSAFTIQAVTVNNIVSGERVEAGSSLSIPWSSSGISTVGIQYTLDGVNWTAFTGASDLSSTNGGTYSWNPVLGPSSNLVQVRVTSTTQDSDGNYAASTSPVFTIYGVLTINTPASTAIGTPVSITWSTSPTGAVADVNLYYSTNGSTWTLINTSGAVANTNSYSLWTPAATGDTYQVRVVDANDPLDISSSGDFSVTGIAVSSPSSASSWACGSLQTITWNYTGALSSFNIKYYNGSALTSIASSIGGSTYCLDNSCNYSWTVPNVPVLNSYVQITSGSNTATSSDFNIPAAMTAVSINSGRPLNVGVAYNITWTPAAGVTNIELQYSTNGGSTWNTIVASISNSSGTSGYSWTVPNAIGTVLVKISDADPNVPAASAQASFTIQPDITVTSPSGGVSWAVFDPSNTITWTNTGTVSNVELYYATSPYSSWTPITIVANGSTGGSYAWASVPDILLALTNPQTTPSLPIELKVADTSSGAFAVSSPFNVIYYATTWDVEDSITSSYLSSLSVTEFPSGSITADWSASGLSTPYTHYNSYGTYSTTWADPSHTYINSSYNNWLANQNQTLTVKMTLAAIAAQAYNVYSNFTYDAGTNSYLINSWIEQAGTIVTTPSICIVTIVDLNDTVVDTLTSSSPDSNGVFRQAWNLTGLNPNSSYLGKVQILDQGSTYSANAVYSISVPAGASALQVQNLGTQFSNFATTSTAATTGIQSTANTISTSVGTNLTGQVSSLQGTDNTILTDVGTLQTTDSDVLASVGPDLTTQVSGLQTTDSNILTSVGANLTGQLSGVGTNVNTLNTLTRSGGTGDLAAILANASTAAVQAASAATGVSAVQATANNISTSVGSNLTGQVTSIASTLSSLSALTTTINSLLPQLNGLATVTSNINTLLGNSSNSNSLYGKLATINANINTIVNDWGTYKASDIVNNANTMATTLGTPVDSCGMLTVFGKMNCVYNQGGDIQSASALANQAYKSIQQFEQQITSNGKSQATYSLIQNIGNYTNGIANSAGTIPQGAIQPELSQISQNVQAARQTLAKTASQAGITGGILSQGAQTPPVTLDNLHQELLQLKQMTEFVKNTLVSKEGPLVKTYFENGPTNK